jgi:hypothetical protein
MGTDWDIKIPLPDYIECTVETNPTPEGGIKQSFGCGTGPKKPEPKPEPKPKPEPQPRPGRD